MNKQQIVNLYMELHELYRGVGKEQIRNTLRQAEALLLAQKFEEAEKVLNTLENKESLLEKLMQYLRGKPVQKTLKKILANKTRNKYETLVGLSSLCTHLAIECSRGKTEYAGLLREMHSRIGKLLI